MATLTGTTIQSTYDSLLKVTDNDAITSTLKRITDGLGNNTPLYLSSSAVEITSGLNVIGSLTASNVSGSNTGDETKASIETKLGAATSSNNGYLTSGDWSTFNNKIAGSGTLNRVSKFSSTGSIADSNITDNGALVSISTATTITGDLTATNIIRSGGTSSQFLKADGSVDSNSYILLSSLSASSPLSYNNLTGAFSIQQASGSQNGFLSSTDWTTFNNKQNALTNPVTGTGTTNTLPKFTGASAIGNSNITDTGSLITLNSGARINGNIGIDASPSVNIGLRILRNITGSTASIGTLYDGVIQSDVTGSAAYYRSTAQTAAAVFTLPDLFHFQATQGTLGAGSVVTNQSAFRAASNLIGATNNFGFYGDIPSGTGRWNLYMAGTANNYLAGSLGIGTTSLTGFTLAVNKNITGAANSYSTVNQGVVQSDVTRAYYYDTFVGVQNTAFTLSELVHYNARGAGSFGSATVTEQAGYAVRPSLVGATNNFGYLGQVPSGTGNWNLYMSGTANNYLAGNLVIGTTAVSAQNLRVSKSITGNSVSMGIYQNGQIQSDVGFGYGFNNESVVSATSVATDYVHYRAVQGTWTAGGTVTNQIGFLANSTLTSATNNFGFRGIIASGANRWNLYMDGTANNYLAGSLGIGTTSLTGYSLNISQNTTGATTGYGALITNTVQSDVTSSYRGYSTNILTQAASFTLPNLFHFRADQGTIGAGSSVTTQTGFHAAAGLIGATENFGFRGQIPAGTNRWNIYMDGTANNHLAGSLGIGSTSLASTSLRVAKNTTGSTTSSGVVSEGTIQSDVTDNARVFWSRPATQAATFTLTNLPHYFANQGTFGAGSTVTNQYGVFIDASLIGGVNNFGLYSNIPAGTNRWNLYMNGTARNFLAGTTSIGSQTDNGTGALLQVAGGITYTNIFNRRALNYTLTLTDQNDIVEMNVGSANTVTVPTNASVAFPVGTEIAVMQYGSGQTTIVASAGVTIRSKSSYTKIADQYTGATLVKVGTDEWYLVGNLTA